MYSVHMVQHLLFSMVATPLLLLGTPAWLARWLLRPPSAAFRVVRRLARFLPALIVFNVVLVLTHWPLLVNESLQSGLLHFGVHALLFVASLIVWLPVVSPLPEIPRLAAPTRAVFLFLQSVVPTVPASFLTFGSAPLYKFYEGVPHLWGVSTLEDQQIAGLMMKIGAGLLLWMLIAVIFFRWAADEDSRNQPQRIRRELERELSELQAQP
jgi:putative membrane protein